MKNLIIFVIALCPLVYSCTDSRKTASENDSLSKKGETQPPQCYIAIDGKDTAHLTLRPMKNGKLTGDLVINYAKDPKNDGALTGEFKGDTLFADYLFTTGDDKKMEYRNPLAFLKQGNQLTLGVGTIETYMGRSYFAKGKPIDFQKGRFKFNPTDCEVSATD